MKLLTFTTVLAAGAFVLASAAYSQNATAPAPAPAPAPKATPAKPAAKMKPEQTAKSKACSEEADKQGLHGKARKKFREECKRKP